MFRVYLNEALDLKIAEYLCEIIVLNNWSWQLKQAFHKACGRMERRSIVGVSWWEVKRGRSLNRDRIDKLLKQGKSAPMVIWKWRWARWLETNRIGPVNTAFRGT